MEKITGVPNCDYLHLPLYLDFRRNRFRSRTHDGGVQRGFKLHGYWVDQLGSIVSRPSGTESRLFF
jgi:hypothetical protein